MDDSHGSSSSSSSSVLLLQQAQYVWGKAKNNKYLELSGSYAISIVAEMTTTKGNFRKDVSRYP